MLTGQQYFAIFISLIVAVYLFLQPLAGIDTIPWIVLIPFCLTLLYRQPKKYFLHATNYDDLFNDCN